MTEATYVCAAICRTCNGEELASAPYDADGDGNLDHETAGLVGGAAQNHLARYPDHVVEFVADDADSDAIWREVVKIAQEDEQVRAAARAVELNQQTTERRRSYEERLEARRQAETEHEQTQEARAIRATLARRRARRG